MIAVSLVRTAGRPALPANRPARNLGRRPGLDRSEICKLLKGSMELRTNCVSGSDKSKV